MVSLNKIDKSSKAINLDSNFISTGLLDDYDTSNMYPSNDFNSKFKKVNKNQSFDPYLTVNNLRQASLSKTKSCIKINNEVKNKKTTIKNNLQSLAKEKGNSILGNCIKNNKSIVLKGAKKKSTLNDNENNFKHKLNLDF